MIWCFKLITVIVDICMCIMSEGNLNQNKTIFKILLRKYFFYFMIGHYSMPHKIVIMKDIAISF